MLEMVVVTVIIGILSTITVVSYGAVVKKSRIETATTSLETLQRQAWTQATLDNVNKYNLEYFNAAYQSNSSTVAGTNNTFQVLDHGYSTKYGQVSFAVSPADAATVTLAMAAGDSSNSCVTLTATKGKVISEAKSKAYVSGCSAAPIVLSASASGSTVSLNWPNFNSTYTLTRQDLGQNVIYSGTSNTFTDYPKDASHPNGLVAGGAYKYNLVVSGSALPCPLTSPCSATVSIADSAQPIPAVPTNLVGSTTSGVVYLTWASVVNASGYRIYRAVNGQNPVQIGQSTASKYTDSSTTSSTFARGSNYQYSVTAFNDSGESAAATTQVYVQPAAPGSFTATTTGTTTTLRWLASPGATTYTLYKNSSGSALYTGPGTSGGTDTNGNSILTFTDTSNAIDTKYTYVLTSSNPSGTSNSATATTYTTPAAPGSPQTASSIVTTSNNATISWKGDSNTPVTGYSIYRQVGASGGYALYKQLSPATKANNNTVPDYSFSDSSLASGTEYDYKITAFNAAGESAFSSTYTLYTSPSTPTNFSAQLSSSGNSIRLDWDPSTSTLLTGYKIYRTDSNATSLLTTISAGTTTYTDNMAVAGNLYSYQVSSYYAPTNGYSVCVNTSAVDSQNQPLGCESPKTTSVQIYSQLVPPTSLTAVQNADSSVSLSWTPPANATPTGYSIYISQDGSKYFFLTSATGVSTAAADSSCGTTYYVCSYKIAALYGTLTSSLSSATATIYTPPAAPVLSSTMTSVSASWKAYPFATSYTLLRNATAVYTGTALSFTDTNLLPGTNYSYTVQANTPGASPTSSAANINTVSMPVSSLSVSVAGDGQSVQSSWPTVPGATGYHLYRLKQGDTTQSLIQTILDSSCMSGTCIFTDSTTASNTTYTYYVDDYTAVATASKTASTAILTPPAAPAGLAASLTAPTTALITWSASSGATSYTIYKNNAPLATISAPTLSYTDVTLSGSSTYTYAVAAVNSSGLGPKSNSATVNTPTGPPISLTAVGSGNTINISWTPPASGIVNYYSVYYGTNGTTFTQLATNITTTSYASINLSLNTTYYYKVTANTSGFESPSSNIASAITAPNAPTSLSATPSNTTNSVLLTWSSPTNTVGYYISRSTTSTDPGVQIASVPSGSTLTYTDTTPAFGAISYYHVQAYNSAGTSTYSNLASALIVPSAPSAAISANSTNISLTWTASSGATAYTIFRSTDGTTFTLLNTTATTNYADSTVLNNTTYYYKVAATNTTGTGPASSTISILSSPKAPVLTATANTTTINLSWPAVSGASSYVISKSTDNITFTQIATPTSATLTYADSGLINGKTYYYQMYAVGSTASSVNSNVASALTSPLPVTNLTSTDTSTTVTLSWTAPASATSFTVTRNGTNVCTTSSTTCTETGLAPGTNYTYLVYALNTGGSSTALSIMQATLPSVPTGVTATTTVSATAPTLYNTVSFAGVSSTYSYNISRSVDGAAYIPLFTLASGAGFTYQDTSISNGHTYSYVITASFSNAGTTAASSAATTTTAPLAITNLAATAVQTTVNLTWTASSGATSYAVSRSVVSGGPYTVVNSSVATTSYSDVGLGTSTTYYYVVTAIRNGVSSPNSTQVSAITVPSAPGTVTATKTSSSQLSYNITFAPVTTATSYNLSSSSDGVNYSLLNSSSSGTSTITMNTGTLVSGTTYYFAVSAVNAAGIGTKTPAAGTYRFTYKDQVLADSPSYYYRFNNDAANPGFASTADETGNLTTNLSWTGAKLPTTTGPLAASIADSAVNGTGNSSSYAKGTYTSAALPSATGDRSLEFWSKASTTSQAYFSTYDSTGGAGHSLQVTNRAANWLDSNYSTVANWSAAFASSFSTATTANNAVGRPLIPSWPAADNGVTTPSPVGTQLSWIGASSPALTNNAALAGPAWLRNTFTTATSQTGTFYAACDDDCVLFIDNNKVSSFTGSTTLNTFSYTIPAGSHTIGLLLYNASAPANSNSGAALTFISGSNTVVHTDSAWKYYSEPTAGGAPWYSANYWDDSSLADSSWIAPTIVSNAAWTAKAAPAAAPTTDKNQLVYFWPSLNGSTGTGTLTNYSSYLRGGFTVPADGNYSFYAAGDDSAAITLNGGAYSNNIMTTCIGATITACVSGTAIALKAGVYYSIGVTCKNVSGTAGCQAGVFSSTDNTLVYGTTSTSYGTAPIKKPWVTLNANLAPYNANNFSGPPRNTTAMFPTTNLATFATLPNVITKDTNSTNGQSNVVKPADQTSTPASNSLSVFTGDFTQGPLDFPAASYSDGNWHLIDLTYTAANTTLTLCVDGGNCTSQILKTALNISPTNQTITTGLSYWPLTFTYSNNQLNTTSTPSLSATQLVLTAPLAELAGYPTALTSTQIANHYALRTG